jgi:hypothetical protein
VHQGAYTHGSTGWGQHPFRCATQAPLASGRSQYDTAAPEVLHRGGCWAPEGPHEAMCDLVRARQSADRARTPDALRAPKGS